MSGALLLLGHAFPLDACLNGHPLAHYVCCLHLSVRERSESATQQQTSGSDEEEAHKSQENTEEVVQSHSNSPGSCARCKEVMGKMVRIHSHTAHHSGCMLLQMIHQ